MAKYLPDQCLDPFTFHSVMDAANAKYHLARVSICQTDNYILIHMVPIFSQFANSYMLNAKCYLFILLSLLQDVLAEIPSQVVQYMDRQGIKPGIPEVDVVQKRLRSFAFRDE